MARGTGTADPYAELFGGGTAPAETPAPPAPARTQPPRDPRRSPRTRAAAPTKEESPVAPTAEPAPSAFAVRLVVPERRRLQVYSFTGDPEHMEQVAELAHEAGVSVSDVLRQAIAFFLTHVDRSNL